MITPQYTMTVSDLGMRASFDKLTPALRTELRKTISTLTEQLLGMVKAREPVRTGYMRSQTVSFIDERESMIRGRVRIIATGRGRRVAAAFGALEYGAHKRIAVGAHTRGRGRVRGYERTVNIAAQRFLRDPAAIMRPKAIAEIEAAVGRAVSETQR